MSTAATAEYDYALPAVDESNVALPLRGDTFLGVCEAVGQDLGFHPNWLRVPFSALILWNPAVVVGAYLGLGGIVALSRWLYPAPRAVAAESVPAAPASETAAVEESESAESKELLAA